MVKNLHRNGWGGNLTCGCKFISKLWWYLQVGVRWLVVGIAFIIKSVKMNEDVGIGIVCDAGWGIGNRLGGASFWDSRWDYRKWGGFLGTALVDKVR